MQIQQINKALSTSKKVDFTFKSSKYNQYVQTHMSWHDQKRLTQAENCYIPIHIIPPKPSLALKKNSTTLKMPIPQFLIDKMEESEFEDSQSQKMSLGVQKQNSFLITSQMSSLPFKLKNMEAQTQTDDFTFLEDLFSEPKIYQIPVQVDVEDYRQLQEKQIQVNQSLLNQFIQKIQLNNSAVPRQLKLQMNSGIVSFNVQSFSFSKFQKGDLMQGSSIYKNSNNQEKAIFEQQEELLLQISPQNYNKQNLYRTGNFEMNLINNEFFNGYTPPKSRVPGSESSPDTEGQIMQLSQKQINMMQVNSIQNDRIDEQQYQDLQNRFYLMEQENIQKSNQIQILNNKLQNLLSQINKIQGQRSQILYVQGLLQKYKFDIDKKQRQIQELLQSNDFLADKIKKYEQIISRKEYQIDQLMQIKQRQMRQLQVQINVYREQYNSRQQKIIKQNQSLLKYTEQKQQQIDDLKIQFQNKYQLYLIEIKQMEAKIATHQNSIQALEQLIIKRDTKIQSLKEQNQKQKQEFNILMQKFKQTNQTDYNFNYSESNPNQRNNCRSQANKHCIQRKYSQFQINQAQQFDNNNCQSNVIKQGKRAHWKSMKNILSNNQSHIQAEKPSDDDQSPIKSQSQINKHKKKISYKANKPNLTQQVKQNYQFDYSQQNSNNKNKAYNNLVQDQKRSNIWQQDINQQVNGSKVVQQQQSNNFTSMNQTTQLQQQEGKIQMSQNQNQQNKQENQHWSNIKTKINEQSSSYCPPIKIQQNNFINYSFQKHKDRHFLQSDIIINDHQSKSLHQRNIFQNQYDQNRSSQYSQQLQKFIMIYEAVIQKQLQTIQQLQQKVLQFLKDALTKETQAQLLYSQLCQYQNNLNALKIQKIDSQFQNQRLKKMIGDSQSKLSLLGNRLIRLAKTNSSKSADIKQNHVIINTEQMIMDKQINR